jgi:predicted nucleic acid-binding protein
MIDTSVLVAGLVSSHEFHELARPTIVAARNEPVPGIVLAESWAVLRRAPFNLDAAIVESALAPWATPAQIVATPPAAYAYALREGRALNLGGNVHDLLIALTCADRGQLLTTLDRRQAAIARTVPRLEVRWLLES